MLYFYMDLDACVYKQGLECFIFICIWMLVFTNKGNNKITELRTILQREGQNS